MQDEYITYLNKAKQGDNIAIDYIFTSLKPTILTIAKKLSSNEFDFEEAVQEANIGLFKAILSFDETRNVSFPTFASKCITNNILSAKTQHSAQKHKILTNAQELDDKIFFKNPEADFIIKEQNAEFIKIAKEKLSDFEFLVFSLYTMQYSYKEIAQLTTRSEKAVNNAIQRIHKKLRK